MIAPDIAQILINNSIGIAGTDLFVGNEPTEEKGIGADVITIYDTGSAGEENSKFAFDNLNFQVRVRNKTYAGAMNKSESIKKVLQGMDRIEVNGNDIIGVYLVSGIFSLGNDDRDRQIMTANYRAVKQIKNSVDLGNRDAL